MEIKPLESHRKRCLQVDCLTRWVLRTTWVALLVANAPLALAESNLSQDWFAPPAMTAMRLSPSGEHAAYFAPARSGLAVTIKRLTYRPWAERVVLELDSRPVALSWATDERLIIQSIKHSGLRLVHAVNRDGSDPLLLSASASPGHQGPQLLHLLSRSPGQVLLMDDRQEPWVPDVFRVDLYTGDHYQIADNPGNVYSWQADLNGEVRLAMTWRFDPAGMMYGIDYRDSPRERWQETLSHRLGSPGTVSLGFMPDNQTLVVASDVGVDKSRIRLYEPAAGLFGATLHADPEVDVASVSWSAASGTPAFIQYDSTRPSQHALDDTWESRLQQIARRVGQQAFRVVQVVAGGQRVLVLAYSDRHPGTYYLFEPGSQRLRELGDRMPGIDPKGAATTQDIEYLTRDDRRVSGYLTKPNRTGHHPLVVLVHGGPWSRDFWGYDPLVQFLAERGFAVLQSNFRGSRGFGREHLFAGQRQWGRKMQRDLEDAVAWAETSGHAEPGRSCIMGSSYGGYAALMGAIAQTSPFRCAVSWVGVTDLAGQIQSYKASGNLRGFHEWAQMVGSPADPDKLDAVSPLHLVDQIQIPILIGHGLQDNQVDFAQAKAFFAASRAADKDVAMLTFAQSGHDLASAQDRRLFYHAAARFMDRQMSLRREAPNRAPVSN